MLIPLTLNDSSLVLNETEEYLYENYLKDLRFDARGFLVINEESQSIIETKIKDYIENEGDEIKNLSKKQKSDIDSLHIMSIATLGIYLLGALLMVPTAGISMIIALISIIILSFGLMIKSWNVQKSHGKLMDARRRVKSYISKTKDSKIKEKLIDLEDKILSAIHVAGGATVVEGTLFLK